MDFRERFEDAQEALRTAIHGALTGLWTALPCIVQSFNAEAVTVVVQPAIQAIVRTPNSKTEAVDLPLLADVPVCFQRGGGCTLTFPIQKGDECLVVFSSRCIDSWWQSGGVQMPMEPRRHDLSDGFALIGPFSQQTKISGISAQEVQLRSDDGATTIALDPLGQIVRIKAPGGVTIDAPNVRCTGNLRVQQQLTYQGGMVGSGGEGATAAITGALNINGHVTANGKRIDDSHTHSGVKAGGDTSGPVA